MSLGGQLADSEALSTRVQLDKNEDNRRKCKSLPRSLKTFVFSVSLSIEPQTVFHPQTQQILKRISNSVAFIRKRKPTKTRSLFVDCKLAFLVVNDQLLTNCHSTKGEKGRRSIEWPSKCNKRKREWRPLNRVISCWSMIRPIDQISQANCAQAKSSVVSYRAPGRQ